MSDFRRKVSCKFCVDGHFEGEFCPEVDRRSQMPIELKGTNSKNENVSVWACGAYGTVQRSEEEAKACCGPNFCKCGKRLMERYKTECTECWFRHVMERDQKLYDEAKKVPFKEYSGTWLYCDSGDRYFGSLDELLDHYYDETTDPEDMPSWAWGTTAERPGFSAEELIRGELENGDYPEDYYDEVPDAELKEMQDVLDRMVKKMHSFYNADHSTVVTFEAELEEYLKSRKDRSI